MQPPIYNYNIIHTYLSLQKRDTHACLFLFPVSLAGGRRNHRGGSPYQENAGNKPWFKPTQQNITVHPGVRAVLRCRVENLGTKTVSSLLYIVALLYVTLKLLYITGHK